MAHRRPRDRKENREGEGSPPRLVGYCRVSTEEQTREGVSLDAQADRLRAYATAHEIELVGIETDAGVSGRVPPAQRPGLSAALERIRRGEADGLVAIKLDRISRSTRDALELVDQARRRGWRLVSVSEHLDTASAAGRLVVTVLAALAEMEREQTAERVRDALAYIGREGRARSRFTPFGWRTADGGIEQRAEDRRPLVAHEAEQRALARLVELHEAGLGVRRIAARLGANPRSGRAWSRGAVASVLERLDRWSEAGIELPAA